MGIPIIGDIIDAVGDLASEVLVDKDKKNEINYKLEELKDKHAERDHEATMGQLEINKVEAQHTSIFVAGWRPFIGWTGGAGFAYATVIQPLGSWIATVAGYTGEFPVIDTSILMTILTGILGIGGYRTIEKKWGVDTKAVSDGRGS